MPSKSVIRLAIAAAVLTIVMLAAAGCGDSSPTAAVEGLMNAAKEKNCAKMVDYFDMKGMESQGVSISRDELIKDCEESGMDDVVSYKILEEKTEGDSAEVKVELTTKQNGQEETVSDTLTLIRRDGEWKFSTI